jgi:hypothetical protein
MNGLATYWINRSSLSTQFPSTTSVFYWTSDASWNSTYYWLLAQPYFSAGGVWTTAGAAYTHQGGKIIPIRRFTAGSAGATASGCTLSNSSATATLTASTTGTCLIVASIAADSNYNSATSSTLTFTFTKANQDPLSIGNYLAFANRSLYPLNVYGGSGTGSVTRTLAGAGSAGCSMPDAYFLNASSAGSCTVTVTKAGDSNYNANSTVATIYWVIWSDSYAIQVPSTPTEIGLQHVTQIIRHEYQELTITSYKNTSDVVITSASIGNSIRIYVTGLDTSDDTTQVTFTGNEIALPDSLTSSYIQITIPTGALTGVITVDTQKGTAVGTSFTINP